MTRKFIYIECGDQLTTESNFFVVSVTQQTKQGMRDFLFLTAYSADHQHYFCQWSQEVDLFLDKVAKSLEYPVRERMQKVSARDLVRAFKASTAIPLSSSSLHQQERMRYFLDTNYRVLSNLRRKNPSA